MRVKPNSIRWEYLIALVINGALLVVFFCYRLKIREASVPLSTAIAVDISDFSPPVHQEMPVAENVSEIQYSGSSVRPKPDTSLTPGITDLTADPPAVSAEVPKNIESHRELDRIERDIQFFDGINQIKSGIPHGTLPAGHLSGVSFQGRRDAKERNKHLRRYGGSKTTECAVEKALAYLARIQNLDGSWGSKDCFKTGDVAALSSLALLAFFSHGETFQSKYGKNIHRGCDFLIELANTPNVEYAGNGFGHAILTYALAEGFAITGSLSLRNALEQRLKFVIAHQNKFGSFSANYDNSPQAPLGLQQKDNLHFRENIIGEPACDLSLLGWHIQALVAAKNAGIRSKNLDRTLELCLEALVKIHQAENGGFSHGINMRRFPANENMNAVGLLGMYFLKAGNSSPAHRAERILFKSRLPQWNRSGSFPLYRWYYQTQAIFQAEKGRGKHWKNWNENLKAELLKEQQPDGAWAMPKGDNSFRIKNPTDLSIYATSLCTLMLQVYYRYLPSYSIAESAAFSQKADEFDIGATGLISRLPGGADPMASIILGLGSDGVTPIRFGIFNGIPKKVDAPLARAEFECLASMRSTIAVRSSKEWPQTLQANQRIALFLDDLIPKGFKGHMRLLLGVLGTKEAALDNQLSLETILNGKRLFNAFLNRDKQLIEIIIPQDAMQAQGNILQIRNNGKAVLALDAAELASANKIGQKIFLLAEERPQLPGDLRAIFNVAPPKDFELIKLSSNIENKQLLPEITAYDSHKTYIAEISATGSEYMGNEFHKYYLRQTGRNIVDWLAGGGAGIKLNAILSGGKFYDSIFMVEYPAAAALRQTAKLFEGTPRKLFSQVYPKYGQKPSLFLSSAASYNAPGVSTIVIAQRFPIPEEFEILALIPWSGETEVIIERGFLHEHSPFIGFASKIEVKRETVTISDNIFRYSSTFPELTVIRLIRKGMRNISQDSLADRYTDRPSIKFNHTAIKHSLPPEASGMTKQSIRKATGYVSVFGQNVSNSIIPATILKNKPNSYRPKEKESICITFNVQARHPKRFDSSFLPLGGVNGTPYFLTFDVYARTASAKKRDKTLWVTMCFALGGKLYSSTVKIGQWQKIVSPLRNTNPAWQYLRVLPPGGLFDSNLQTVSFEINDIAVYSK